MIRLRALGAIAAAALGSPASLLAGPASRAVANVRSPATAAAAAAGGCTLSIGALDFGRYDYRSNSPSDFTATLVVRCSGAGPTIAILGGPGGQGFERSMSRGAAKISYNLYLDAARTRVWGDGTLGSAVHVGRAGSDHRVTIYGRVPPHQSVPAGAYFDAVVIAVQL